MELYIPKNYQTRENPKKWQFCIGSGHAHLALRSDYARQLKFVHDELGIQRVRFHGIFCDDMSTVNSLAEMLPFPGAQNFREINFRACGAAYDNVLSAGMKPFVEISFMPRALAQNPGEGGFIYYKPCTSLPKDDAGWKEYLKRFVRFLEHRYGAEEVRTWYFEIWNEPDLGGTFFQGGDSGYFHLYRISAEAIKEADPAIRVGGPATSGSRWVGKFRKLCEENHVPLDFLSTHQYAGDPIAGVEESDVPGEETRSSFTPEKLAAIGKMLAAAKDRSFLGGMRALLEDKSETTEIPEGIFRKNAAYARREAGNYPLFYTEWGENAIFSAETNDTRKTAAYIVKNALETEDYLDGSSVWCFSDIFEEWHPFVEPFHGGFGILNLDGIPKPSFWGMKLLSLCGSRRVILPEEQWNDEIGSAAFCSSEGMQILLFRQKMKNDEEAPKLRKNICLEMDREPENVSVMRIDSERGNPLRIWKEELNSRNDLNAEEIRRIADRSRVTEEKMESCYDGAKLHLSADLGVNDVYLIQIRNRKSLKS